METQTEKPDRWAAARAAKARIVADAKAKAKAKAKARATLPNGNALREHVAVTRVEQQIARTIAAGESLAHWAGSLESLDAPVQALLLEVFRLSIAWEGIERR